MNFLIFHCGTHNIQHGVAINITMKYIFKDITDTPLYCGILFKTFKMH